MISPLPDIQGRGLFLQCRAGKHVRIARDCRQIPACKRITGGWADTAWPDGGSLSPRYQVLSVPWRFWISSERKKTQQSTSIISFPFDDYLILTGWTVWVIIIEVVNATGLVHIIIYKVLPLQRACGIITADNNPIDFEADKGSRYNFSGVARKHRILAGKSYN